MIHEIRKQMDEAGSALSSGDKEKIESAIADLETATKGTDKAEIDSKFNALMQASQPIAQAMQAKNASQQGASGAQQETESASSAGKDDDVIDGEFTEK